jgi:uncharacterized protein with FMN-binding domain
MKMVLKIVGLIFLGLVFIIGGMTLWTFNYHKKLKAVALKEVDLSKVKDGTYQGRWDIKMWTTPVEVMVANHKITSIKITRDQPSMSNSVNELINRIIQKQSLNVDAIAGATITTKAILKSTELALEKGLN